MNAKTQKIETEALPAITRLQGRSYGQGGDAGTAWYCVHGSNRDLLPVVAREALGEADEEAAYVRGFIDSALDTYEEIESSYRAEARAGEAQEATS